MAVAVGRVVAVPGVSCELSSRRCSLKETPAATSWNAFVKASSPSSSGRASLSWHVSGRPVGVRCTGQARRQTAAKELYVDADVVELDSTNAIQLHYVKDTSGAVDGLALLSEFEGLLPQTCEEVTKLNDGSTIFLVGMMASGKSTVGRVLSDSLGYTFFDSDEVIESLVGGLPVKEIFRQHSESAFRDLETRALQQLSVANSLVVATGGGAVCRDENWSYLLDGIVVWLDVPVEDLAERVTTVGTESRPLLGGDCSDFEKTFSKLTKLMDARERHYARAHCRLSFRDLAISLGLPGVAALTPTAIAVQVLKEIKQVLQEEDFIRPPVAF